MFAILIFLFIIPTNALEAQNETEKEIQGIFQRYLDNISDFGYKYVVNERLSKSISTFFNGKISVLPLFRISVVIDRKPVKIPWTVGHELRDQVSKSSDSGKIEYKYIVPPPPKRNLTGDAQ